MYPLAEGLYAARNQWYVAGWSKEINREPMERWILNEPVAFYRTEAGEPVALAGRCPHRHFPLGKSRLVGDNIECSYHGITFSPKGACVRIPSQAAVPSSCSVKSFPIVERWEWVWIWMGDPALADESLIPDHHLIGLTDPDFTILGGSYHAVPGRYMLMHDNLFDLTHFAYLHKTSIGSGDFSSVEEQRENGDDWISSRRVFPDIDCPPFYADLFDYYGKIDREFGMKLYLPCLHVGFDNLFRATTVDERAGEVLGRIKVYHAITPATRNTAHYFFALGRTFKRDDAGFGQAMLDNISKVVEEDLVATLEIEAMITGLGGAPDEVLLKADATCVRGRRLFEGLIRKEQARAAAPGAKAPAAVG